MEKKYWLFGILGIIILLGGIISYNLLSENIDISSESSQDNPSYTVPFDLAVWGVDANVTLNSPADNATSFTFDVSYNSTANVTGGDTISNISLWDNSDGTWKINQTLIFYGPSQNVTTTAIGDSQSGETDRRGIIIVPSENVTVTGVSLFPLSTAGTIWITDAAWNDIASASVTSLNATFDAIPLEAGVHYRILAGGGSYTSDRNSTFGYPRTRGSLEIHEGSTSTINDSNTLHNIHIIDLGGITYREQIINSTINQTTLWNIEWCDNSGACGFGESNWTVSLDSEGPTIILSSPLNQTVGTVGQLESVNWTVNDTNLDSCWYNYNGTNQSVVCSANTSTFTIENINSNLIFYSNDTIGNENNMPWYWNYNLTEIAKTFPSESVESATEEFIVNISFNSSKYGVVTADLFVNDTSYVGTSEGSGDNILFSANATLPSVDTTTNISTYWTVSLTDAETTVNYNLSNNNVSVQIINMSLCSYPLTVSFWNFTILNETDSNPVNATFDATFTVRAIGSSNENEFSFSYPATNNTYNFCFSPPSQDFNVDTNIVLTAPDYVDTFYNFENIDLTNTTKEDNLYLLTGEESTSFVIHVVDVSGTDVEGAEVIVQRFFPGTGTWVTTEILTTNTVGETIGHFLTEDVDYRFIVNLNGQNIHNSASTKVACTVAPCTITLVIPLSILTGYEEAEDLTSTLTYSPTTNIFTYTYSDTSESFNRARLYVYRTYPTNATLTVPCNSTKSTASGIITCDISSAGNGTYQASGYITRNAVEFLDQRLSGILGQRIYNALGLDGVLWSIFIFLGIIMLGAYRPTAGIIFATIGFIVLAILQVINIGALSIVSIVAIAIMLLTRMGRE